MDKMQAKEQVPAHSKILPAQIGRVDVLKKHWCSLYYHHWLTTIVLAHRT